MLVVFFKKLGINLAPFFDNSLFKEQFLGEVKNGIY